MALATVAGIDSQHLWNKLGSRRAFPESVTPVVGIDPWPGQQSWASTRCICGITFDTSTHFLPLIQYSGRRHRPRPKAEETCMELSWTMKSGYKDSNLKRALLPTTVKEPWIDRTCYERSRASTQSTRAMVITQISKNPIKGAESPCAGPLPLFVGQPWKRHELLFLL